MEAPDHRIPEGKWKRGNWLVMAGFPISVFKLPPNSVNDRSSKCGHNPVYFSTGGALDSLLVIFDDQKLVTLVGNRKWKYSGCRWKVMIYKNSVNIILLLAGSVKSLLGGSFITVILATSFDWQWRSCNRWFSISCQAESIPNCPARGIG